MTSWEAYRAEFQRRYDALKGDLLEAECVECGPFLNTTSTPKRAPWKVDWAVIFKDGNYVRIKEIHRAFTGTKQGEREHFSFHYGPAHPTDRDRRGMPTIGNSAPPAVLRIDVDRNPPHIHLDGEDHIEQSRVVGFTIHDADMVDFLRAVVAHRKDGSKTLAQLLNISVK
jgi:hypothetical protein